MSEYGAATYGDGIADVYDAWYGGGDTGPMVERLAALAGRGPVLELGIGTGRVALPLAAKGVAVHGIDASDAMLDRLRAKEGAAGLSITQGDFTDFDLDRQFTLVYVVFNTFFSLLDQESQVRCFRCVAGHLAPGGRFVLECFVPDLDRFDRGQRLAVTAIEAEGVRLEAALHDPIGQKVKARVVSLTEAGSRFYPLEARYCWPSELDLMARLANLRLEHRWGGWRDEPFTGSSASHVSVYVRPG
jgi:SAM-dependent methyltransferase